MTSYNNTRVKVPTSSDGSGSRGNDSVTQKWVEDDDLTLTPSTFDKAPKIREKTQKNVKDQNKKNGQPLVSCRQCALVGTFNVRTAREGYKRLELVTQFLESGMEILGIQEHRIVHQEPIRIEKFKKGVCLVTVSAWRNGAGAANGGVGFLLTSKAYDAISLIKSYGSRVLTISYNGNPRLTTITAYSPTEAAPAEEAEDFHNTLRQAMADVPAHHLLITTGDMNARLGKESQDDPRWYFHTRTNRNGELLRDTALECDMEISNHRFRKKANKMWTHLSDGTLTKGQIDYILIRRKWKNSLKNTEAYNTFQSLGSDHRVVVCKVKVSFRKSKRPAKRVHYDYSALKVDTELQERYAIEVQNRFSCLVEEGGATESYGKLVEAIDATNKALLPKKARQKQIDPASDPRVDTARKELFLVKDKYHQEPCEERREEVASKKDLLKTCYTEVEEEILNAKIRKVEETADRCKNKESWNLVNDITGRTRSGCGLIDGGSSAERLENWKKHFSGLLGQPPQVPDSEMPIRTIHPPLNIETGPFTREELHLAKKQIVEGKAHGDDGISPEVMKRVDIDDIILQFCNEALSDGPIPEQWKLSNIIPVPKKGDLTKTDNYRGISLTSIVSKTLNRMLLNRIKPSLEEILRDNQNGFRPGRSTTSHIIALRRIIEGAKAKNLKATIVFIDFKKAFDSVHRGLLMKILRAYGIPDDIVRLIERMHEGTKAKVLTADGITEVFDILAGVLQGDTLAPYLFIIVIDYIMTVAIDDETSNTGFTLKPARSRRVGAEKLIDTEFADDVALITDTIKGAQLLLDRLEEAAQSVGLVMNDSKTKFMTLNTPEEESHLVSSSGKPLEKVTDFVYLGAWIATTERDLSVRKAKAWAACHKLQKIWKSNLRRGLKIRLFVATVESILLYGSETWTLTEALKKKIDGCYTRMLRMALNIDWRSHTTNKEVYGHLPKATMKIQERRMRLAGHVHRHPELVANRLLLWEPNHGARSRGRPCMTYVDNLRDDTGLTSTGEIGGLMADRLLWRQRIDTRTQKPP